MRLIVYGDFNCPYSYLASQRADVLARLDGAEVEWRAVEHDPRLPLTGLPSSGDQERWKRDLAEVAALARPGERPPAAVPKLISNTEAAVAAYAEAVSDGVQGELRRRLFSEIWERQRHLSSPYEVRKLVAELMYVSTPLAVILTTPDMPTRAHRIRDLRRLPRISGCTIAVDGGPLTYVGYQRIKDWRQEWQSGGGETVPALTLDGGDMISGVAAVIRLGELVEAAPQPAGQSAREQDAEA
jgi:2-hydroxychromene-2-carboxylate isomerase